MSAPKVDAGQLGLEAARRKARRRREWSRQSCDDDAGRHMDGLVEVREGRRDIRTQRRRRRNARRESRVQVVSRQIQKRLQNKIPHEAGELRLVTIRRRESRGFVRTAKGAPRYRRVMFRVYSAGVRAKPLGGVARSLCKAKKHVPRNRTKNS